ncbi:hypothetical protein COCMIDRAFT_95108 [Bipolaris oryzae ATCC 44560]|uniref:Uncharacterized protein n=1 Tax=Bipolaris oryzae ATCC 44560 TaxID=930090 RepID=W6Z1F5_COCMI|nr:uncharacterized protein COCMIDRAFT_95108 [Bipolaris oryzae ATCC 44560]EUC45587.1 hypothetical protein COCMIDRAFT_95108 [Bipolaris oryzae ATCC 44560]
MLRLTRRVVVTLRASQNSWGPFGLSTKHRTRPHSNYSFDTQPFVPQAAQNQL